MNESAQEQKFTDWSSLQITQIKLSNKENKETLYNTKENR